MTHNIRLATLEDKESLLALMQDHARYEGHELQITNQGDALTNMESLPITIFVVEFQQRLLGYMSVVKQFSTWDMDWYLYLDCLYLTEETRGKGIGLELMQLLQNYAKQNQIQSMQWQTPIENESAIGFYQKLKAVNKQKQRFFWPVF